MKNLNNKILNAEWQTVKTIEKIINTAYVILGSTLLSTIVVTLIYGLVTGSF